MIFRPSRDQSGPDRFFAAKTFLLVLGASVGLAGMVSNRSWMVYVAIGLIAIGILLRVIGARSRQ